VIGVVGYHGTLEDMKSFGKRCALVPKEHKADVDQGPAWKSIDCSGFCDYVSGEMVIHYIGMDIITGSHTLTGTLRMSTQYDDAGGVICQATVCLALTHG
jgi:hypothetical protein